MDKMRWIAERLIVTGILGGMTLMGFMMGVGVGGSYKVIVNQELAVWMAIVCMAYAIISSFIGCAMDEDSLKVMPSSEGSEGQASGFPKAEEPRDEGL